MTRKRYDVVPRGSLWRVIHDGTTLSQHYTKSYAVDAGVQVARANVPSQLLIHRADGTIEDERTYGNNPPWLTVGQGLSADAEVLARR